MSEIKNIPIAKIETNKGQIEGLPKNPRFIKDYRFEALKKSISDAPEMLALRELIVFPNGDKFVTIGGNMRLKACQEIGYKELPCKVLDENTPVEKLREYAIKDNVPFGSDDFDLLANEWDENELLEWGFELPNNLPDDVDDKNPYTDKTEIPQYEVKGENYLPTDLYDETKTESLIDEIEKAEDLMESEKSFLIAAAKRHTIFNYRKIAEYYASATPQMQRLMERSALVIVDLDNAIANGYAECSKAINELRKQEAA